MRPLIPRFSYHPLGMGRVLELGADGDDGIRLVSMAERGAQVGVPAGWTSVWIALKGDALVATPHVEIALGSGHSLTWADGAIRAGTQRGGWLLGLAAPAEHWGPALPGTPASLGRTLFSRVVRTDRDVLRLVVRLMREVDAGGPVLASMFQTLRGALRDSQADLEPWIQRCSGHTRARKEHTLHRLMRARNVLLHSHGVDGAINRLAELARFSPTHFKRMYREVFGLSPGEHASQLKVEHTWRLITSTSLTLVDVCEAVGFESKSAFCRTFKQRFGLTTTQARERLEPRSVA